MKNELKNAKAQREKRELEALDGRWNWVVHQRAELPQCRGSIETLLEHCKRVISDIDRVTAMSETMTLGQLELILSEAQVLAMTVDDLTPEAR